ncbi:MAG TPA: TonB-dependent receptor [Xanthobacteraceae bacterium]|jgi:iron complex outermembrane receptor protein|nr:TonB-dependent receptor [Xanthobacteraceae bacterium]
MSRFLRATGAAAAMSAVPTLALAQSSIALPEITVEETAPPVATDSDTPPLKEKFQLPNSSASTTKEQLDRTVNVVDAEDTVKYLPSLFVRKRNNGDTQPVLATRTSGIAYSARSLVYADDILLSALIANNNTIGSPRWGLISPEEIARVDFLYGPFSAAYPGNSVGGVLLFTTRMPTKPEATLKQTESFQTFDGYKTNKTFRTDQTSASFGNRWSNGVSLFVSGNFQNSDSQPLAWITTGGTPAGTSGTIPAVNRTGSVANVVGAGGLLHTEMANLKAKLAVDLTDWLTATYTVGYWSNDGRASVDTYLRDAAGRPTFGNVSAFASNFYSIAEKHLAQALSLKTNTRGAFDWDISVSRYDYLQDIQRNPFTVATGANFSTNGKITRLDGTNWTNADAKGIWRPGGNMSAHEVSFGVHQDDYRLNNPAYATPTWNYGPDTTANLYSFGRGATQTSAAWVQDAWRFAPQFKLTVGGRFEYWRAFNGHNLGTTTNGGGAITGSNSVAQPREDATRFSPKASLNWAPNKAWEVTGSFGVANRFPTVSELYQIVTSGSNIVTPNPNLQPEKAYSSELAVERKFSDGHIRLSLFNEYLRNALLSQAGTIAPDPVTLYTSFTNVDAVRNRGIELAWQKSNVAFDSVDLFGSVTYVDSRILSDPTFKSTTGTTAVGKHAPYVPAWRTTLGMTYRATDALAMTVAARYQSKIYGTLDNTDTVRNVFQAFDPFFVVDTRLQYKVSDHGTISAGIDNLNNAKYTLFHPFPQRTYVIEGRLTF